MMRFHTFDSECGKEFQDSYNRINHGLGANVVCLDLTSMGGGYRYKSEILDIIRSDQQTWVWVFESFSEVGWCSFECG